jgi:hypothetical protein
MSRTGRASCFREQKGRRKRKLIPCTALPTNWASHSGTVKSERFSPLAQMAGATAARIGRVCRAGLICVNNVELLCHAIVRRWLKYARKALVLLLPVRVLALLLRPRRRRRRHPHRTDGSVRAPTWPLQRSLHAAGRGLRHSWRLIPAAGHYRGRRLFHPKYASLFTNVAARRSRWPGAVECHFLRIQAQWHGHTRIRGRNIEAVRADTILDPIL